MKHAHEVVVGLVCVMAMAPLAAGSTGVGRPATDRGWWGRVAALPEAAAVIRQAEESLQRPMPAFDAERYLDFTRNGDRERYQHLHRQRWDRLKRLVLGECLENRRRFVPAIVESVESLCGDPSWILPAHDHGARVFHGAPPYADLAVAMNGYQMAMAAWLLGDRLPPPTLALMREHVSRRLTGPVLATIDGQAPAGVRSGHWWMRANHNWNAVCTAGATGAILLTEPSPEVRTKVARWAAANMELFLSGFAADGYCSEGIGYWNYGFGHFVVLAELLRREGHGAVVDLYAGERVRRIARAPGELEIADGIFPAFADCQLTARPDPLLVALLRHRLDGVPFADAPGGALVAGSTLYLALMHLEARLDARRTDGSSPPAPGLRSWFPDSGLCVSRAAASGGLAVAWKAGHNAEHHNHNDVGTTVVVWRGRQILADPGAMVYRAETFSKQRYRLLPMSSFAHSVPVPAGLLQADGAKARGRVLATDFNERHDRMLIDLRSAYPDAGLVRLERQWTHLRDGGGRLEIEDRFAFEKPSSFATALVGFGTWHLLDESAAAPKFLIDAGGGAMLEVATECSAAATWQVVSLPNPGKPTATRLGIELRDPAGAGSIRLIIRPATRPQAASATRLPVASVPPKLANPRQAPVGEVGD